MVTNFRVDRATGWKSPAADSSGEATRLSISSNVWTRPNDEFRTRRVECLAAASFDSRHADDERRFAVQTVIIPVALTSGRKVGRARVGGTRVPIGSSSIDFAGNNWSTIPVVDAGRITRITHLPK